MSKTLESAILGSLKLSEQKGGSRGSRTDEFSARVRRRMERNRQQVPGAKKTNESTQRPAAGGKPATSAKPAVKPRNEAAAKQFTKACTEARRAQHRAPKFLGEGLRKKFLEGTLTKKRYMTVKMAEARVRDFAKKCTEGKATVEEAKQLRGLVAGLALSSKTYERTTNFVLPATMMVESVASGSKALNLIKKSAAKLAVG